MIIELEVEDEWIDAAEREEKCCLGVVLIDPRTGQHVSYQAKMSPIHARGFIQAVESGTLRFELPASPGL